ncbi:unnamed protein product [Chrysoparadoxa australica]
MGKPHREAETEEEEKEQRGGVGPRTERVRSFSTLKAETELKAEVNAKAVIVYPAETHFRQNLEWSFRTALASCFGLLWARFGPFRSNQLSFFCTVIAIVTCNRSVGSTIESHISVLHGAATTIPIALAIHFGLDKSTPLRLLGVFIGSFLIIRRQRLESLGKKLGCVMFVLAVVEWSSLPPDLWFTNVIAWARTYVEGGVFGVLANLLPYPRLALMEGARKAQYISALLSAAASACTYNFIRGRDEVVRSEVQLLLEQLLDNIARIKDLVPLARLELLFLFFGQAGLEPSQLLADVGDVMLARTHCIEGMRHAMASMAPDVEHAAYISCMRDALLHNMWAVNTVMLEASEFWSLSQLLGFRSTDSAAKYKQRVGAALAEAGSSMEMVLSTYQLARLKVFYGIDWREDGGLPGPPADDPDSPFNEGTYKEVRENWLRQGFIRSISRSSFMFNMLTLTCTLSSLRRQENNLPTGARRGLRGLAHSTRVVLGMMYEAMGPQEGWLSNLTNGARSVQKTPLQETLADVRHYLGTAEGRRRVIHPVKLAFVITVCSLFSVIPAIAKFFTPSIWISITASFVLSEDSSTALITAHLRLVGSVIGAVYSWVVAALITNAASSNISPYNARWYVSLAIPPWVAFTCFFRSSKTAGYAAVVSAFTAVLLIVGTFSVTGEPGAEATFKRVQNSLLGVFMYVFLDTIIFPVRAATNLQTLCCKAFDQAEAYIKQVNTVLISDLQRGEEVKEQTPGTAVCRRLKHNPDLTSTFLGLRLLLGLNYAPSLLCLDQFLGKQENLTPRSKMRPRFKAGTIVSLEADGQMLSDVTGSAMLKALTETLEKQEETIYLAALEPTLWYRAFQAPSYQHLVHVEWQILSALIMLDRAVGAFSSLCDGQWSLQLQGMSSLTNALSLALTASQEGLIDAILVFKESAAVKEQMDEEVRQEQVEVRSKRALSADMEWRKILHHSQGEELEQQLVDQFRSRHAQRIIETEASMSWVREFLDTTLHQTLYQPTPGRVETAKFGVQLEFTLRFYAVVSSIIELQRVMLKLGHAIHVVSARERHGLHYE